ncbi:MAG: class II myosin [Icmadophila ericetorum]|nr:class II myosin [Icmadophila ericetorum]
MAVTKRAGRKKDAAQNAQSQSGGGKPQVRKAVFESTKKKEVGVSDLTLISKISEDAINDNLKKRFENGSIYTYIGHVLVSVNPFRDLGIYTDQVLDSYRGKNRLEVPPHVFAIAESAYYNMKAYKANQCVIISGESGAGKTEAAKRIMQYIASVSGGSDSSIQEIKDMVLATNPLLESFGNAKTLRNNNSSRFGKYLELQFNAQGEPVGANITNYLLEKSRVVGQIKDERNFHIFYQFTKAASQNHRENFGVQTPESYVYTSRSKCFDVAGIDDHGDFKDTLNAMRVIGLAQGEQDNIFRMLAAILWIGNVTFREDESGSAAISDQSVIDFVAYLLEVDAAHVLKALTLRIVETSRGGRRGSIYEVPLNITQATAVRDALAKAIYFNLFDWIVTRLNASLRARGAVANSIGILDIYGFEIFERNSFEQLCINYVNEKLQQIFIQLTLQAEQQEYADERIQWTPIEYFNNKVVCDLIELKRNNPGVFAALNDACATAHADSGAADGTFTARITAIASNPYFETRPKNGKIVKHFETRTGGFIIRHYAGDVGYATEGLTDKNKDQLLKDLLNLVGESSNSFVHGLFPNKVNQDDKKRPPTAGDKIIDSANDLVTTLKQASPSYIRTIKPNEHKSPTEYAEERIRHQIKYLGLEENVRIRRAGFAYRQPFDKFVERFFYLSSKTSYAGVYTWTGDALSATKQILKDSNVPKEEYQMGVTKAFIKTPETLFALEAMRDRFWHNMAIRIQRAWRRFLRYRAQCALRIYRFWKAKRLGLEWIPLRTRGHELLNARKERRSYSVASSRRYVGDYLGIGNRGGPGELIARSINIGGNERVYFSCRCDLLVTKFGRSSKPSPRMLVLTNKSVYIVIQALVNNQLQISSERTIPVGAVKYVSTSNLQDDWFSLGVSSPQEPDPLINCVFKTEFFTQLERVHYAPLEQQRIRGKKSKYPDPGDNVLIDLRIASSIEYNKKPGKPAAVKAIKDPKVGNFDVYKSGSIHIAEGLKPGTVSKIPKTQPRQAITNGQPRRPNAATSSRPSQARPVPQPNTLPNRTQPAAAEIRRPVPQPVAVQQSRPVPAQQSPAANGINGVNGVNGYSHGRTDSSSSITRVPPPPPPPPPAELPASKKDTYRVLYDFAGQTQPELTLVKDELLEIIRKEGNGWWLARKLNGGVEGWAPSAYLKEEVQVVTTRPPPPALPPATNGTSRPATKSKPAAPVPPAKRPAAGGRKPVPAALTPRDSAVSFSLGSENGGSASGRGTPDSARTASLAGGLAEALKARQASMQGREHEEEDW